MKVNFLQRMKLWQKFALLGAIALLMTGFPFYQFISATQSQVEFAQTEASGIDPTKAVIRLIQLVQQHRGLSANVLGGNESAAAPRSAKETEVNQALAAVDQHVNTAANAKLKDAWAKSKQAWAKTADAVNKRSADVSATLTQHRDTIADLLVLTEAVADHFKLTLDPEAHTYFLIQASLITLPRLTEPFGQARALGTGRLAEAARARSGPDAGKSQAVSAADRVQMTSYMNLARERAQAAYSFLDKAFEEAPGVKGRLEGEIRVANDFATRMIQLAGKEFIDAQAVTFDAGEYYKVFTDGIDAHFKLAYATAEVLKDEMNKTIAAKQKQQALISGAIFTFLTLGLVVGVFIVRNITGTVKTLQSSVERVRAGDESALSAIDAQDEVGDLGRTVNSLLDERVAALKKSQSENEALNNSVVGLLQAMFQLSQRDLTVRATVTEDVVGTVADSVNQLASETGTVLSQVTRIASYVEAASQKVRSQSDKVNQTAEAEREQIERMAKNLNVTTEMMNNVAKLAERSNKAAEQATQTTGTALATVNKTVQGMDAIRETIAETEKRIKRLGERSQEITGIVNLINTISERTHMLALNASMQAAMAGEAGRGFAVVAEEVQRLAESSNNATQQIAALVNNIQIETNDTIATVNRTIAQVVEGSKLAQESGEQMRVTQETTNNLVELVKRIGAGAQQQMKLATELRGQIDEIGTSVKQTAEQIQTQSSDSVTLVNFSKRLVESVSVFKLPEGEMIDASTLGAPGATHPGAGHLKQAA